MNKLHAHDTESWLETIWSALHAYRNDREGNPNYDEEWSDICTAMAWIEEELNAPDDDDELLSCKYCSGNCMRDNDHACDGYLGDIDKLYAND
jgi:hypothetical protein